MVMFAPLLLKPSVIEARLQEVRRSGLLRADEVPNLWQVQLGVLRMWHRVFFRSETIGISSAPIRQTRRARLLSKRPFRFPFLVRERAVAPLDFSGLISPPWRIKRHLLGAYHDGAQFIYDLELLVAHEGALETLYGEAVAVRDDVDPRSEWLKDLVVYEGYHARLVEALDVFVPGRIDDPDISFFAYLRWCARQPATLSATLRAHQEGRFTIADGVTAISSEHVAYA